MKFFLIINQKRLSNRNSETELKVSIVWYKNRLKDLLKLVFLNIAKTIKSYLNRIT